MTKLLAFDHQANSVHFQATKTDQLQSRHIFELKLSPNRRSSSHIECITCDLHSNGSVRSDRIFVDYVDKAANDAVDASNEANKMNLYQQTYFQPVNITAQNAEIKDKITNLDKWIIDCDNYDASFSSDFQHFVLICNGPNVPYLGKFHI